LILVCLASFALLIVPPYQSGDWKQFRGPNGSGIADDGALPREIGAGKNVMWKSPMPAGKSSPVITTERIYLIYDFAKAPLQF